MNERQAREATLLQAFESASEASPNWSDEDRRWVDRVALEAVGSAAPADDFIVERAHHAMHRLLPRERAAARWLERRPRWAIWLGLVVVLAAGAGVVLGPGLGTQRINLITPPFWGVMLWNLVVYAALLVLPLVAALRRKPSRPGPLRRGVERLLRSRLRAPTASPLARFAALWSARSARLLSLRAQTLLHAGAAALGLGLIAGLYLRGISADYRVGWESTFPFAAETVYAWLSRGLAPASALSGIALPDAAGFAAMQARPGDAGVGAPAAPWIHLLAITMGIVVVVPRLVLAAGCTAWLRSLGRRFVMPLDEPYFQRLARLQRGAAAAVDVFPYAHTPTPQAALGLQALVSEAFGPKASVRIAPTIVFGAEDDAGAPAAAAPGATHVVMLCDLAATPEFETHGRCAAQLRDQLPPGALFALLVDESAFRRRFAGLRERLQQRRAAWSDLAARIGSKAAFADLGAPLDGDAVAAWHAAFADAPASITLASGPRSAPP